MQPCVRPYGFISLWVFRCLLILASLTPSPSASSWTEKLSHGSIQGYPSFDETNALLQEFLAQSPGQLVKQQIGSSYEKRPIYAYVLGTRAGRLRKPPQVLLTALTHAREPAGLTVLLYFLGHLLEKFRKGDPDAVYVLETREIWFVPFVNPDGYVANQGLRSKVIRKNRRPTCRNSVNGGVDINRNFGTHWSAAFGGCDEEHGGTKPFSEPETQALKKICEENNFKTAMNYHAYGSMLTHPYNWASKDLLQADDKLVYQEIAKVFGWKKFGPAIKTVGYTASGESDDWMYATRHIISMSPEVGPESGGFWPRTSLIDGIDSRNFVRSLYVVLKAGMELQIQWTHEPRGVTSPQGTEGLRGGLPKSLLQLRISNLGLSSSSGKALGVAVQGAVRSGTAPGGDAAVVLAEGSSPIRAGLTSASEPILAFQVGPVARRSHQSLGLFVGRSLEPDAGQPRRLQLCVAEVHDTASPTTGVSCHCSGLSALPAVDSQQRSTWTSDRESFALPSSDSTGDARHRLCAEAAAAGAGQVTTETTTTTVTTTALAPALSAPAASPVEEAATLSPTDAPRSSPASSSTAAPASSSTGVPVVATPTAAATAAPPMAVLPAIPVPLPVSQPSNAISAADVSTGPVSAAKASQARFEESALGTWVLLAMGATALSMGLCLLTQSFVKTRTSVAKRAPSASDFERIPGPQVTRDACEDSDDLGFSRPVAQTPGLMRV